MVVVGCGSNETADKENTLEVEASQVEVIDGDTIKVRWEQKGKMKQETVRLLLIDSPELNHPKMGEQPYGEDAKKFVEQMLKNAKNVTIEKDQTTRDKYNRFLAHVYIDKVSLQEALLEKGLARIAYVQEPNVKYLQDYKRAEQEAKEKGVGIWSVKNYAQKDGFHPEVMKDNANDQSKGKFVASKNSDVYHPEGCHVVKDIKVENRIYFDDEEEAKASGRKRSKVEGCWDR